MSSEYSTTTTGNEFRIVLCLTAADRRYYILCTCPLLYGGYFDGRKGHTQCTICIHRSAGRTEIAARDH